MKAEDLTPFPGDNDGNYEDDGLNLVEGYKPGHQVPDLDFPPDPELVARGWERRFMADPVRAREAVTLYTELGFEVHLAKIEPVELSEWCGDCGLETCLAYVTIYTRRKTDSERVDPRNPVP